MTEEIRWGIIGCGDVTEMKSGPAFNKVPNSKLVAVMRRNKEKAHDYAQRHHVPRWYTDASALLNDAEINAIYIATPPLFHREYALAAIRAGKALYVEKPMAIDFASAKAINHAAMSANAMLSVAHYRRQLPLFLRIKEMLDEGAIGDIHFVNMKMVQPYNDPMITQTEDNWRVNPSISGGGLFHDLAPHQLDLMRYFFGEAEIVKGLSGNQGKHYPADDIVQAIIRFENNIYFNGLWCFTAPLHETKDECEIVGSKGKLTFGIFAHDVLHLELNRVKTEMYFENPEHVQQPMIAQVVQYFLGKSANPCSGKDGVEVMRMIDDITRK